MKVKDVMTKAVHSCAAQEPLAKAAAIMWQHDCGCVPIVDEAQKVIGMITDRDICMATWIQGKPVHELTASVPMSKQLWTCRAADDLDAAERTMRDKKVRRLPVVDAGMKLVGILSLSDIARVEQPPAGKPGPGVTDATLRRILKDVSTPRET